MSWALEVDIMVGERRRHEVPLRQWTSDVDEDEVRAVATLAVEAYDFGRSEPDDWPGRDLWRQRQHIEPIRAAMDGDDRTALYDACAAWLDRADNNYGGYSSAPTWLLDFGAAIDHLRSVLFKEPHLRWQARQLAAGMLFSNRPRSLG